MVTGSVTEVVAFTAGSGHRSGNSTGSPETGTDSSGTGHILGGSRSAGCLTARAQGRTAQEGGMWPWGSRTGHPAPPAPPGGSQRPSACSRSQRMSPPHHPTPRRRGSGTHPRGSQVGGRPSPGPLRAAPTASPRVPATRLFCRWNQAHKSSGTNFQGLPSKIDTLKEEMDEAGNKVEQCKVRRGARAPPPGFRQRRVGGRRS